MTHKVWWVVVGLVLSASLAGAEGWREVRPTGEALPARAGQLCIPMGELIYLVGGFDLRTVTDSLPLEARGQLPETSASEGEGRASPRIASGTAQWLAMMDEVMAESLDPEVVSHDFHVYSATEQWLHMMEEAPFGLAGHSGGTYNDSLLIVGASPTGEAPYSSRIAVMQYEPARNIWHGTTEFYYPEGQAPPPNLAYTSAVVHDSTSLHDPALTMFGGFITSGTGMLAVSNQTWAYYPYENAWRRKSDLPVGTYGGAVVQQKGKAYLWGGISASGYVNALWVYDPQTDEWTFQSQMNPIAGRTGGAYGYAPLQGMLYYSGGAQPTTQRTGQSLVTGETWRLSLYAFIWERLADGPAQVLAAGTLIPYGTSSLEASLLLFGGVQDGTLTNTISGYYSGEEPPEEFDTPTPTSTPLPTDTALPEGTATPTPTVRRSADLNGDGRVDALDLMLFLREWHLTP